MSDLSKLFLLLVTIVTGGVSLAATAEPSQSWEFSVLLDGSEIGYHRFELVEEGGQQRMTSEAKFDVRFLFINAFRYRHANTEVWSGDCLRTIESNTLSNGTQMIVSGSQQDDRFVVNDGASAMPLQECVMTFAYWNPAFLQQARLLNPQSGEFLDVDVEALGRQPIRVRGREIDASAFRLTAKQMELTLWYSPDDEWLALESVAKGGRIIRYELT